MMPELSTEAWGVIILVALYVAAAAALELRDRQRRRTAARVQQCITEWQVTTHLDDCRRDIHRTTLDADYHQVFGEQAIAPYVIYERCIDCGLVVPFGRVTRFTAAHTHRKTHG